jgi:UMF1 family MFS transporter
MIDRNLLSDAIFDPGRSSQYIASSLSDVDRKEKQFFTDRGTSTPKESDLSERTFDRPTKSWVLYDVANSAFSTAVMAGFFPIFFKQYWNAGVDPTVSTLRLGMFVSSASLLVAILAPVLGAIGDASGTRRRYLLVFAALGATATALLFLVAQGQWVAAGIVYVLSILGFSGSMVFYDSLLVAVSRPERADMVSAVGFAAGYLGGGVLFLINVWMTRSPGTFGLSGAEDAVRVSFLTVAVWWVAFTIPLAMWVREQAAAADSTRSSVREGFRELVETVRGLRHYRLAFMFLIAYFIYIDGVHTIVRMAVDYGLSLGFDTSSLITALLIVQFVGFPCAIAFGKLAGRIGTKSAILLGIGVYAGICLWGYRMAHTWEFYALAVAIGLVQGGVQSLSRSYFSRLIPRERAAQFFGFYNTVGRFSAVLGPLLMGWIGYATGNPRFSMFAVMALFVVGGAILYRLPNRN